MTKDPFSLREEEIFSTLRNLNNCEFVLIGGYAVNAYALPRFSLDCDIVVRNEDELCIIQEALKKMGYSVMQHTGTVQYTGKFERYEKQIEYGFSVGVDILMQKVVDRMTSAEFDAEWVFKNSSVKTLKGKTFLGEEARIRTINIDALLVMKIISCRATDIRDVFMMSPNITDREWVKREVSLRYDLNNRLNKITAVVTSRQFIDGLSGVYGYFDKKVFERHKSAVLKLR